MYILKNVCPKCYSHKKHFITRNSCKGTGKTFLVKIKNKMLLQTIRILLMQSLLMEREIYIQNSYADQVNKLVVYTNCDNFLKEESVTKNSRKGSGIKTTHRSKMLPNAKKQIKNITIHRNRILQSCLFIYLIFVYLLRHSQ